MYTKSEELVKEIESAIQKESNASRKSQYQILLQTQKNISANLKSLSDSIKRENQQAQDTEFASESYMNTAELNTQSYANANANAEYHDNVNNSISADPASFGTTQQYYHDEVDGELDE